MGTIAQPASGTKPAVASTQNWMNLLAGLGTVAATLSPAIGHFMATHAAVIPGVLAIVNILWRTFITKQPVDGIFSTPA